MFSTSLSEHNKKTAYELCSSSGQYCLIGYKDGTGWRVIIKSDDETKITNDTLYFVAGSWYSTVYERKVF